MNFLKALASYVVAPVRDEQEQNRKRENSDVFEIIEEEEKYEVKEKQEENIVAKQTTRYYIIENEFFNNVVVEKDQHLKVLNLEEWRQILKKKSLEGVCQKNLVFSIMKGIPNKVRKQFWEVLADTKTMKQKFQVEYRNLIQKECKSKVIIEKDVPRTKIAQKYRSQLSNILTAYSNVDPMGYTQGMNLIVGSLLNILASELVLDQTQQSQINKEQFQQKVFWVFLGIMYGKNWRQCFEGMKGVQRMLKQLQSLMAKHTPKILSHIQQNDLDLNMCFAQYYLTLVIYNTPIQFATIILDLFLLQGQMVIHSVILKMMKACQQKILQIDDMGMLVRFFKTDMLQYCHEQTQKQCAEAQTLDGFIINFFTLTIQ